MFLRHEMIIDHPRALRIAKRYLFDGRQELKSNDRDWNTAFSFFERAIHYARQTKHQEIWDNTALEIIMAAYLGQVEHALSMNNALSQTKAIAVTTQAADFYLTIPTENVSYKFLILAAATTSYYVTEIVNFKLVEQLESASCKRFISLTEQVLDNIAIKVKKVSPPFFSEDESKLLAMIYFQQAKIAYALFQTEVTLDYFYHALHAYSTASLNEYDREKIGEIYTCLALRYANIPCFKLFENAVDYFTGCEEVDIIDLKGNAHYYDPNKDKDGRINSLIIQFLQLAKNKVAFAPSTTMLKHQLEGPFPHREFLALLSHHQSLPTHQYTDLIIPTRRQNEAVVTVAEHRQPLHAPVPKRTVNFLSFLTGNNDLPKDNECVTLNKRK